MNRRVTLLLLGLVLLGFLLLGGGTALVELNHAPDRNVYFTDQYRLGTTLPDSLVVVADSITLQTSSHIIGNAALIAGDMVSIEGLIDGDVSVISPSLNISREAQIQGNLSYLGDTLELEGQVTGDLVATGERLILQEGAHITGALRTCPAEVIDNTGNFTDQISACQQATPDLSLLAPALAVQRGAYLLTLGEAPAIFRSGPAGLALTIVGAVSFIGLAVLAVSFFPLRFAQMQDALLYRQRRAFLAGLLTLVLTLGLGGLVTLLVGLFPPVGLLAGFSIGLSLLLMSLIGWMVLALRLGEALTCRLQRRYLPPAVAISLGSLLLAVVWHLLLFVPFGLPVGLLIGLLIGSLGLGAVVLTGLGGRSARSTYFVQG